MLQIRGERLTNARCNTLGFFLPRLRKHQGKFVSAVPGCGINRPAMKPQYIGQPAQRAASDQVPVCVIDLFQAIQIEKQHRKRPPGAQRTLGFRIEDIEQFAIIGEPSQRITRRQVPDLLENPGTIEKAPPNRMK